MGLKILRRNKKSSSGQQGQQGSGAKSLPGGGQRPSDTSTITTRQTHHVGTTPYQKPIYQPTPYADEEVTTLPPLGLLECTTATENNNNVANANNASTMSPAVNSFPIVNDNEWPVAPSPPTPMNTPAQQGEAASRRHLHVDLRPATSYNQHQQQQPSSSYNVQQQPTNHSMMGLQKITNLPPKSKKQPISSGSIDPMAKQFKDPPATHDPPGIKKSTTPSLKAVMQREISKHRTASQQQQQQQAFLRTHNSSYEGKSVATSKSRGKSVDRHRTTTNHNNQGGGSNKSVATSRSKSLGRTNNTATTTQGSTQGGGGGGGGGFNGMQKVGEIPKRSKSPWKSSRGTNNDNRSQGGGGGGSGSTVGGKGSNKNSAIVAGGTAVAIGTLGVGGATAVASSSEGGGRFTPRFLNRKSNNKSYKSSQEDCGDIAKSTKESDFPDPDTIVNLSNETEEEDSVTDKCSCGPTFGVPGYDEDSGEYYGEKSTSGGGNGGTATTVGGDTATQYTVGDEATYITEIDNDREDSVSADGTYEKGDDRSYDASRDDEEEESYVSNTYESFDGDESYGESYDGTYLSQDYDDNDDDDDTARGSVDPPGNDRTWSSWFGLGGGGNKNDESITDGGTTLTPEDDDDESTRSTRSGASTVGTKDTVDDDEEEDNNNNKKNKTAAVVGGSKANTYDREGRPLPESRPMSRVSSFKQTLKKLKVATPHSPAGKHHNGDDKSLATTASVSTKGSHKSTTTRSGGTAGTKSEGLNGDVDTRGMDVNDDRQRDIYCRKHGDVENLIVRQYSAIPNVVAPDHVLVKIEVRVEVFCSCI